MPRSIKVVVALICLVCILAFCIAPCADIPATALRSMQAILLLLLSIAATALMRSDRLCCAAATRDASHPDAPSLHLCSLPLFRHACCVLRC